MLSHTVTCDSSLLTPHCHYRRQQGPKQAVPTTVARAALLETPAGQAGAPALAPAAGGAAQYAGKPLQGLLQPAEAPPLLSKGGLTGGLPAMLNRTAGLQSPKLRLPQQHRLPNSPVASQAQHRCSQHHPRQMRSVQLQW